MHAPWQVSVELREEPEQRGRPGSATPQQRTHTAHGSDAWGSQARVAGRVRAAGRRVPGCPASQPCAGTWSAADTAATSTLPWPRPAQPAVWSTTAGTLLLHLLRSPPPPRRGPPLDRDPLPAPPPPNFPTHITLAHATYGRNVKPSSSVGTPYAAAKNVGSHASTT